MKTEPSAADLLDIARATILSEIVPAVAEPQRYSARMAASALAIAARELTAAPTAPAEISRLADLVSDWRPAGIEAADLREGNARLASRIRAGLYDEGEPRQRLLAHLRETTRARLAVSNPRALAASEGKAE